MKTRAIILLAICLLASTANAQFFKKITKSAKKAAERAAIKKTAQKAGEKTENAMDGLFNMDMGSLGAMGGSNVDPSTLPSSYEFDWRYTLQMSHKQGDMKFHYFLSKDGGAFGSRPELSQGGTPFGNMLMVMDPSLETTTILTDNGGQKTGTVMSNPDMMEAASQENDMGDYEFKEIGIKEILGYSCQGFQVENEDLKMTMYVAFDTPVSFNNVYSGNNAKQLPKGFDPKWLDKIGDNSLMMEMQMVHKKKRKYNATMTCVALENEPLTINMAEYDFGFQEAMQKQ